MNTPLLKLKPEVKAQWLDALTSGKYKQTRGTLRKDVVEAGSRAVEQGYCCLGVLTDLYIQQAPDSRSWEQAGSHYQYQEEGGTPPDCVMEWAFENFVKQEEGCANAVLVYPETKTYITNLNDGHDSQVVVDHPHSFEELANIIEEKL